MVGATLVLAGLLGFIADATFDTGSSATNAENGNSGGGLQGDSFLGFEVNGWHNVVHILTGLLLLAGSRAGAQARKIALIFGLAYGLVTIIGMIDGTDVLGLFPVNPADNILHLILSLGAIASALASRDEGVDKRGLGQDRADEDARAGIAGTTDRDDRLGARTQPGERTR